MPWRLLVFSAFLFGFSVFIFLGLKLGYGTYLDAQAASIDADIDALAGVVSSEEQSTLVRFYSQLVNTERILAGHQFISNVFSFLEDYVAPQVYFSSASFDARGAFVLQGRATSAEDVVGQLAIFDAAPEVARVLLGNIDFSDEGVGFDVTLSFKESFFEKIR